MSKLLVIAPGKDVKNDDLFYLIDSDTGEVLASHFCSSSFYAYNDLYGNRKERKEELIEKYGKEIEVKFIDETDISPEELIKKNNEWFEENKNKM